MGQYRGKIRTEYKEEDSEIQAMFWICFNKYSLENNRSRIYPLEITISSKLTFDVYLERKIVQEKEYIKVSDWELRLDDS